MRLIQVMLPRVSGFGFKEAIDRQWVPITCPRCRYVTEVTIRDVRLESVFLCACCKVTCRLYDQEFRARRTPRSLESALSSAVQELNRKLTFTLRL